MSILAEPKRKQRISVDPRNLNWANDDAKFGKKMMQKMGWSDGEGLGKTRSGRTTNLKLQANYTKKGLGSTQSYDSTWIAHHDDFADILSALNKNKPSSAENAESSDAVRAEKISLELTSKSLKRRIHYQKFTRAKDTSIYDDDDKKAILGPRARLPKLDVEAEVVTTTEILEEHQHTVSTLSVKDYFKDKMADKLASLNALNSELETELEAKPNKEKKRKLEKDAETLDEEQMKPKKSKKQKKHEKEREEEQQLVDEIEESPKKKKAKKSKLDEL